MTVLERADARLTFHVSKFQVSWAYGCAVSRFHVSMFHVSGLTFKVSVFNVPEFDNLMIR